MCVCFAVQEVQGQVERICEMGQVMRRAVQVDDQHYCSVRERLAQLEVRRAKLDGLKRRDVVALSVVSWWSQGISSLCSEVIACRLSADSLF